MASKNFYAKPKAPKPQKVTYTKPKAVPRRVDYAKPNGKRPAHDITIDNQTPADN